VTPEQRAAFAADPRVAAWRAKVAADRPPLTPAQIAALRPVWAPVVPHMRNAAPAAHAEAAPVHPHRKNPERNPQ
jgi:hypothetical protein